MYFANKLLSMMLAITTLNNWTRGSAFARIYQIHNSLYMYLFINAAGVEISNKMHQLRMHNLFRFSMLQLITLFCNTSYGVKTVNYLFIYFVYLTEKRCIVNTLVSIFVLPCWNFFFEAPVCLWRNSKHLRNSCCKLKLRNYEMNYNFAIMIMMLLYV